MTRPTPTEPIRFYSVPPVRYPNTYVWFVFVSAMDIMLTWAILSLGGEEVNPIARIVIEAWGLPGATLFKFSLALFVILTCEIVGRYRDRLALGLARTSVAVSALPVVYSLGLLAQHFLVDGATPGVFK